MALNHKATNIPTISNYAQLLQYMNTWKSALRRAVRTVVPPPPPFNFAATQGRGAINLAWAKVQTLQAGKTGLGQGTNPYGADGYEILASASGDFVSDVQVIPLRSLAQTSYVFHVPDGNVAFTCSFRIHTTAGTPSSPHSVLGPDSGTVTATSIVVTNTVTTPARTLDNYTSDATRATARRGRYANYYV